MESKKVLLLATYSISLARKKEREDEALNANFIFRPESEIEGLSGKD